MIKKIVFAFSINFLCGINFAQTDHVFRSIEEALKVNPDSVLRLDLNRNQLTTIPLEIFQFKNLVELNLERNKLDSLPNKFVFPNLTVLNLSKNRFKDFPEVICENVQLQQLFIGKNKLSAFPGSIGNLSELIILDAWYNTISEIPESILNLKKLTTLDLRGMNYSEDFQRLWVNQLSWVKIEFDNSCDCGD